MRAPWTPEVVEVLNRYQAAGFFHPYTCGASACRETLVATAEGWRCPKCSYTQDWAYADTVAVQLQREKDWAEGRPFG